MVSGSGNTDLVLRMERCSSTAWMSVSRVRPSVAHHIRTRASPMSSHLVSHGSQDEQVGVKEDETVPVLRFALAHSSSFHQAPDLTSGHETNVHDEHMSHNACNTFQLHLQ